MVIVSTNGKRCMEVVSEATWVTESGQIEVVWDHQRLVVLIEWRWDALRIKTVVIDGKFQKKACLMLPMVMFKELLQCHDSTDSEGEL